MDLSRLIIVQQGVLTAHCGWCFCWMLPLRCLTLNYSHGLKDSWSEMSVLPFSDFAISRLLPFLCFCCNARWIGQWRWWWSKSKKKLMILPHFLDSMSLKSGAEGWNTEAKESKGDNHLFIRIKIPLFLACPYFSFTIALIFLEGIYK